MTNNDPRQIRLGYFNEVSPCKDCRMAAKRRHLCRAICPKHKTWESHKKECKKYEERLSAYSDEKSFCNFKSGGDVK